MGNDMTVGSPTKSLIMFSIPLLLGNIFQQLYSTLDAVIAGRFIGKNALAVVGVANPAMSIAIFFIFGMCVGISVLLAQLYGARDYKGFKVEVSTSLIAGIIFTFILSIFCMIISKPVLRLARTPHEIINDVDTYLKIIFGGLIFSFLYNFYASALRAMGDTKTPFTFLVISSVLNICLNILFIKGFNMNVDSTAIGTIISQAVSSILCIAYVYMKIPLLSLGKDEFVFKKPVLVKTIQYSWVSAIQQTFLYLGRFLVQGTVNPYGTSTIAAYNTATRAEAFVFSPFDSMSASISTFSAQNTGAGLGSRIKSGYKNALMINIVYSLIACCFLFIFSPKIMSIFVNGNEAAVIKEGSEYLKLMAVIYTLASVTYTLQGLFRGVGLLKITMIATGSQILIRVICSYILVPMTGISGVCYSVGIGWLFMIIYEGIKARNYFSKISV